MDILQYIMQLINNGLFPIVCCGGLVYIILKLFTAYRDDVRKMTEENERESKEFTTAINKMAVALNKLADRLDKGVDLNDKK